MRGLWSNNTATPLERTREFADKPFFTAEEAKQFEATYLVDRVRQTAGSGRGGTSADPQVELDQAAGEIDAFEPGHVLPNLRTSLIVPDKWTGAAADGRRKATGGGTSGALATTLRKQSREPAR
jgi:hypothetical protein